MIVRFWHCDVPHGGYDVIFFGDKGLRISEVYVMTRH